MLSAFQYPFIQNAFLSGSCIAVAGAVVGYFLLARGLTFAGHAIPNIGFAGAAGAVLLGVRPVYGMFLFTMLAGAGVGALGRNARERDVSIGVLMCFALGLGLLFLALYQGFAERVYAILFGTILGINREDVIIAAVTALVVILAVAIGYRPLLFSTFDPTLARSRGVPVDAIAVVFLLLVAVTVSISIQVMGAILVFTLIVGPAATAARLARRPAGAIATAALLGLAYIWIGVILAVASGDWPVSFFVAAIAFAVYLPVRLLTGRSEARRAESARH